MLMVPTLLPVVVVSVRYVSAFIRLSVYRNLRLRIVRKVLIAMQRVGIRISLIFVGGVPDGAIDVHSGVVQIIRKRVGNILDRVIKIS